MNSNPEINSADLSVAADSLKEVGSNFYEGAPPNNNGIVEINPSVVDVLIKKVGEDFKEDGWGIIKRVYDNDFRFGDYQAASFFRQSLRYLGDKWKPKQKVNFMHVADLLLNSRSQLGAFFKQKQSDWGFSETVVYIESVRLYMIYTLQQMSEDISES